jgi:hypothetical protein
VASWLNGARRLGSASGARAIVAERGGTRRQTAHRRRGGVARRVCLYALVAGASERNLRDRRTSTARPQVDATGIAGEPLRVARLAGIDAVIGMLPRAPKPTVVAMRRYDELERALMARYASVLPARFGTCAASIDELAASIRDRRDSLRRTLRLVRHRAQMTVRVFTRSESTPNRLGVRSESTPNQLRVRSESTPNQLRVRSESSTNGFGVDSEPVQSRLRTGSEYGDASNPGAEYLARRMAETQVPGVERLRPAVERWVRAERSQRHSHGQLAGTVYHLVPRSAAEAYRQAISRAALDAGLTTVVSGPWPPYAFAE